MGKRNTEPLPEEVNLLQLKVQEWRRTKAGPGTPMPKGIWDAAVRLAHEFGVCRIARATGLDYVWLRKKLERRLGPTLASSPSFVEVLIEMVTPAQTRDVGGKSDGPGPSVDVTVIEVAGPDGSRMRIQLGAGNLGHASGV